MSWTFYYTPGTCARASHIALEEAGADFEARRIDFASTEQRSPDYLAINPKGRVPALVTERGVLTETPALLAFVAQSFPDAELAPADPFEFARLQAFTSYLCSTVHPAHAHSRRGERWADDPAAIAEMKRKAPEVVAACFRMIEDEYVAGPWVMGERYTVADPYLMTLTEWLPAHGIDSADYPKVHRHLVLMGERAAVRTVRQREA